MRLYRAAALIFGLCAGLWSSAEGSAAASRSRGIVALT